MDTVIDPRRQTLTLAHTAEATETSARVKLRRHLDVRPQRRSPSPSSIGAPLDPLAARRPLVRRVISVLGFAIALIWLGVAASLFEPLAVAGSQAAAAPGPDEAALASASAGEAAAGQADPSAATPAPASLNDEAKVAGVRVELTVWRGGDHPREGGRIARRRAAVDGHATYELADPARARQRLVLLDYAEMLRDEPRELDEIALATYVAGANERARTIVTSVRADGHELTPARAGARRDIVIELPAGVTKVEVEYRVEVPHRYWPLGCVWRRCSLSGAIAPLPSEPARGGVWLPVGGRVVTPVEWVVERVRFGAVPSWEPGSEATQDEARALGGQELVVTREALDPRAVIAYPSVFWGPRWRHTAIWHRGVRVRVLHIDGRPGDHYPDENLLHPIHDVAGHVMSIASAAIDIAAVVGIEPPPDAELTVVQGPLRSDVSMFHPSAVMISDQYLELLATKRLAKFHDIQVARSICDLLAYSHFSGRHDSSTDLWLSGAFGVVLTQLWQRARELRDEFAADLLAAWSFVPAIDSFLYSGQASFSSAYFRGSEDKWPVRHHPLFFANELPTGRRIHEKLSDLLSDREIVDLYSKLAQDPDSDPQVVAEQVWGRELGWFFEQWLGPYPKVDYAITDVRSRKGEDDRWHHEITITRSSDRPLVEPVQVYVSERGGADHYLAWNGEAAPGAALLDQPSRAKHVFTLTTERRIAVVRLDPRARLVETSRIPLGRNDRGDNSDPLFNNRLPAKARFVYRGFGFSVAASELATASTAQARINAISAAFAFEASLRRDLRRTAEFYAYTNSEANVGGRTRFNFSFGPKRNRQQRRMRLSITNSIAWLNTGGLDRAGGMRLVERLSLSHNTYKYGGWPERGHIIYAGVSGSQTVRVDGSSDHRFSLNFDAGWAQMWPLAHHHVLATLVEASVVAPLGTQLEFRSLNRGGGIGGLVGFTSNELYGRGVARALLEYRHVILDDLRIPLLNLLFVRTISGALFGGATSLSACDDYGGWFGSRSWYGQVGYGLAARFTWLGVAPQLLRVDAAIPLGRRGGQTCLGETLPDYLAEVQGIDDVDRLLPPFNINVTFSHPF